MIDDVSEVTDDFYYFVCIDDYRLTDKRKAALIAAVSSDEKVRILHRIGRELQEL